MLNPWFARSFTFLLWTVAAGSATFWALQNIYSTSKHTTSPAKIATLPSASSTSTQNVSQKVALALGAKNPAPLTAAGMASAEQARFQLQGVLAVGDKSGAALIAVDGKLAKPFRVGSAVDPNLQLVSIKGRTASLGQNGVVAFTLELPVRRANQGINPMMNRNAAPSIPIAAPPTDAPGAASTPPNPA